MAWATYTADVNQNSNQVTLKSAVPAKDIPAGFEAIINGIANLEVSYGTDLMYDGGGNPYSHLFLVRPYTGASAVDIEVVIKPTGSRFDDVVDVFRNGSNQASQLMANYYQFTEGTAPIIHQPLDENAAPISIDTLPKMNADVQAAIAAFQSAAGTAATHDVTTSATSTTEGQLFKVGDAINGLASPSDFPNGTLITTSLLVTNDTAYRFEILGKGYGGLSHSVIVEGYFYNGTHINCTGVNYSGSITQFKVFEFSGYVCAWIPPTPYWNSFHVCVRRTTVPDNKNYVSSVEGSTEPTGTMKQIVTLVRTLNTSNTGSIVTQDYEKGTWTPSATVGGVGITASSTNKKYILEGKALSITASITLNRGVAVGALKLSGFPLSLPAGTFPIATTWNIPEQLNYTNGVVFNNALDVYLAGQAGLKIIDSSVLPESTDVTLVINTTIILD